MTPARKILLVKPGRKMMRKEHVRKITLNLENGLVNGSTVILLNISTAIEKMLKKHNGWLEMEMASWFGIIMETESSMITRR